MDAPMARGPLRVQVLVVDAHGSPAQRPIDASTFCAAGLVVETAGWHVPSAHLVPQQQGGGEDAAGVAAAMPCMVLRWVQRDSEDGVDSASGPDRVLVPLYLNNTRKELLLELNLRAAEGREEGTGKYLNLGTSLSAWDVLSRKQLFA